MGLIVALISLIALARSSAAAGQDTATIIGQVTDQSGAVLPGVTVTATSPALQVPQVTAITNEVGEYRLAPLPIGVFDVGFGRAGFRPVQRQNVRLTVGFTAKLDVSLGLATVAETVTVAGAAPVVDVTATSGSTLFTQEALAIPTAVDDQPVERARCASFSMSGATDQGNPDVRAFGQSGGSDAPSTVSTVTWIKARQWRLLGLITIEEGVSGLGTGAIQTRGVR